MALRIKLYKKDILRVLVLITLLSTVIFGLVYAVPYLRDWISGLTSEPTPEPSNVEIAKTVLDWMESNRDDKGRYPSQVVCGSSEDEVCKRIEGYQSGPAVIWARYSHYEVGQDPVDLTKVERDLDVYLDEDIIPTIQIDFWNCRLMQDIYFSDKSTDSVKQKALQLCERSVYNPVLINEFKQDYEEDEGFVDYLEQIKLGEGNIYNSAKKSTPLSDREQDLRYYSVFIADDLARYRMTGEDYYYERSRFLANQAAKLYLEETSNWEFFSNRAKCQLGISLLDLHHESGDVKYMQIPIEFGQIAGELSHSIEPGTLAICGEFFTQLNRERPFSELVSAKYNQLRRMKYEFYDYDHEVFNGFKFNQGAFYTPGYGNDKFDYLIEENSFIIYLLLNNPDGSQ